MNRWLSLLGFLVLVIGGWLAIGYVTAPGEWYAGLVKPSFNPPGWIFGPVWTVLYVLIAVAGWRTFERDRRGWPMRLWWEQLALNLLWSPVFCRPTDWAGARHCPAGAGRDPCFVRHGAAAGSRGDVAVHALCRLGGVRLADERLDMGV